MLTFFIKLFLEEPFTSWSLGYIMLKDTFKPLFTPTLLESFW